MTCNLACDTSMISCVNGGRQLQQSWQVHQGPQLAAKEAWIREVIITSCCAHIAPAWSEMGRPLKL